MYTKKLFDESISALVNAYLNDTLEHGNCTACAVGNLIASRMCAKPKLMKDYSDGEFYRWSNGVRPEWISVFVTPTPGAPQKVYPLEYKYNLDAAAQINLTGYAWEDLAKIESAFESGNTLKHFQINDSPEKEEAMFNGLMAVVDVLCDIHGMNETEKQESKALFVKA